MKLYTALFPPVFLFLLTACGGSSGANKSTEPPIASSTPVSISASSQLMSSTSVSISASSQPASSAPASISASSQPASSSAASQSSEVSVATGCITHDCEITNKAVVLKIYTDIINKNQVSLIEEVFDVNVALHISGANSGSTGETAHLQNLKNTNPGYSATVKHIAADGDYVAVHWHLSATPLNAFSGKVAVDLYKLANNKVVDHWHLTESLSATTVSGNSLFSDLYSYTGTKPVATQKSEADNKALVTMVYLGLFNDKNLNFIDLYMAPDYIQHNPFVADGREAFRTFLRSRSPGGLSFFATLSEDDLVWTFSGTDTLKGMDIFRVDNRILVEHYDVF